MPAPSCNPFAKPDQQTVFSYSRPQQALILAAEFIGSVVGPFAVFGALDYFDSGHQQPDTNLASETTLAQKIAIGAAATQGGRQTFGDLAKLSCALFNRCTGGDSETVFERLDDEQSDGDRPSERNADHRTPLTDVTLADSSSGSGSESQSYNNS